MTDWTTLQVLKRADFQHPNSVRADVVAALDSFSSGFKLKPVVLSDYRPGDPRQHGKGTAIDVTFPGTDPLDVWKKLRAVKLFSGLGIYINDKDAVSFHVDRRDDRTVTNPAIWGGLIRNFSETDEGELRGDTLYTTAERVLSEVKKKAGLWLTLLGVLALGWFAFRPRKLQS